MTDGSRFADLRQTAWDRHANPKSGWSRVASFPLLMLAIYRRDRPLLVAMVAFVVVNPLLFPPPEDDDAWMTRVVYGERLWLAEKSRWHPIQLCNVGNALCTFYAIRAAGRRQPVRTALGTAAALALKFAFMAVVADYHDRHGDR